MPENSNVVEFVEIFESGGELFALHRGYELRGVFASSLGESHDCCKLTFRREGGNRSFTLGLTKSSKNSADVKKDLGY